MFAFFLFFFTMVHRSVSDIVRRVHPSFWAEEPPLEKPQLSSTVYNPAHFPQINLDLTCFLKIVMEESLSQRFILFVYWINLLLEMTIWIFVSVWITLSFFVYICLIVIWLYFICPFVYQRKWKMVVWTLQQESTHYRLPAPDPVTACHRPLLSNDSQHRSEEGHLFTFQGFISIWSHCPCP